MVISNESICPNCEGKLKFLSRVKRIVRTKGGKISRIKIRRMVCKECGRTHRELPYFLLPYKHYEAGIIKGVLSGRITSDNLDFEDYPCEETMKRWKKEKERRQLL